MTDSILRFFGFFDSNGLKYSIQHLNEMDKVIGLLPVERQAKYADEITVKNVNKDWLTQDIPKTNAIIFIQSNPNTTAVGNLAYIALNNKHEYIRDCAEKILNCYREYCMKNRNK